MLSFVNKRHWLGWCKRKELLFLGLACYYYYYYYFIDKFWHPQHKTVSRQNVCDSHRVVSPWVSAGCFPLVWPSGWATKRVIFCLPSPACNRWTFLSSSGSKQYCLQWCLNLRLVGGDDFFHVYYCLSPTGSVCMRYLLFIYSCSLEFSASPGTSS